MKRLIAALLCAIICLCVLPASAQQAANARTPLAGSAWARISNIEIAAASLNGVTIPAGAEFSFNEAIGPRTRDYGYQTARNGRGVKVTGGGVAQVASTLYLALCQLPGQVEYIDFYTYGSKFTDSYVSSGSDAILVDYNSGIDFSFINYGDDLTIEMWTSGDYLHCALHIGSDEMPALDWTQAPPPSFSRCIAASSIYIDGSDDLRSNIMLASSSINDTVLMQGDLFSFNDSVGPRSEGFGYRAAVNGRGVHVTGGGVAQVASAIWLAVKDIDEIAIVEKSTYGSRYNQDYVSSSNDAILTDYNSGADFSFRYTGEGFITISTYVSGDMLVCEIYKN